LTGWAAIRHIDFLGAILSAAATICLLLGLTLGSDQTYSWSSPQVLGLMAGGVIIFALFFIVESRTAEPILPLDLFRNQVFSAAVLLSLLQMMVLMGLTIYLALFFQGVLAISPTITGLVMTPLSISMVAGAMLSSPIISVRKRYQAVAIIAALLMCIGALLIALMSTTTSLPQAILFMVLMGLGVGVFFTVPTLAAQNTLPASRLGVGTAATRYLGQVGAALGIAIVGTAVNSASSSDLLHRLPTTMTDKLALASALQHGFVAVLIFAVIALITTFFLKDVPFATTTPNKVAEETSETPERELVHSM
jgi:MFS family permease